MKSNINQKNRINRRYSENRSLKITALLYLKQALNQEKYEDCADLVKQAKEFGAHKDEVRRIIGRYVNDLKGGGSVRTIKNVRDFSDIL